MNTTSSNTESLLGFPSNPSSPANGNHGPNGNPGARNGGGKLDPKKPVETEITADSDLSLFVRTPADFKRLDGDYQATVSKILVVELPPREIATGKKSSGKAKAKAGKGKQAAKAKAPKPGAKLLRFTFTLAHQRADGATYVAEKEVRPKRERESKFAEFVGKLLPEPGALDQFFTDYRPSRLLNRRCTLKLKELRREGQSQLKILEVMPAPASEPVMEHVHAGRTGTQVEGHVNRVTEPVAIAA